MDLRRSQWRFYAADRRAGATSPPDPLLTSAQLCPDRAPGAIEQIECRGASCSHGPGSVHGVHHGLAECHGGHDELAVGRCVQAIRISCQRYRVGTLSSA